MLQQSPMEQERQYSGDVNVPMQLEGHDSMAARNVSVSEVQGQDAVVSVQNVLTHDSGTTATHPARIQQLIGGGYQNPHNCCYYGASLQLLIRGMGKDNALRINQQLDSAVQAMMVKVVNTIFSDKTIMWDTLREIIPHSTIGVASKALTRNNKTYWQISEDQEECGAAITPLIDNFWHHMRYKVVRKVVRQIEVDPRSKNEEYAVSDQNVEEVMIVVPLRKTDPAQPSHMVPFLESAVQWVQRPVHMEPKNNNVHLVRVAIRQDHIMLGDYVVLNIMRHDFPPHADETKVLDMSTLKYMHDMYGLKVLSTSNGYEYATLC
jgi:hypothetical protein